MEKEIKLTVEAGTRLLNMPELRIIINKTTELLMYGIPTRMQFIWNTELNSLSVQFRTRDELVSWYLFQEDKLNPQAVESWKERLIKHQRTT